MCACLLHLAAWEDGRLLLMTSQPSGSNLKLIFTIEHLDGDGDEVMADGGIVKPKLEKTLSNVS